MRSVGLILCVAFVAAGCASRPLPVSMAPVDLEALEERWSLLVVTNDPDGSERVTRIWIAVLEGVPAIRTNQSRWWANLERTPEIRVRLDGVDYPFRSAPATDSEERVRIDQAFTEKYGLWEKMMFPQARGETHDHYAWLRP